ncbi:MAG TPA: SRPBCC family protein [Bryobacteraceae bacterium]|nr:SRPBCC family protein [Bryobacteraceae bacterium]
MPVVRVEIDVHAPMDRCFDLARDIDLHMRSTSGTKEKAVAGVTSGLIGLDEEVTWEATHFFIRQRLTSRITAFHQPYAFRDSQVSGVFKRFDHDHRFSVRGGVTRMQDVFDYESPLGWLGKVADWLFLKRYLRQFLFKRALAIKQAAESELAI